MKNILNALKEKRVIKVNEGLSELCYKVCGNGYFITKVMIDAVERDVTSYVIDSVNKRMSITKIEPFTNELSDVLLYDKNIDELYLSRNGESLDELQIEARNLVITFRKVEVR